MPSILPKILKTAFAIALLPIAFAEGFTIISAIQLIGTQNLWNQEWLWGSAAGVLSSLAIFALLPRPIWLYVFGHELTHAICAWLAGGKVHSFNVSSQGGYIVTDTIRWWIVLAPYFVPLYTLLWLGLWWLLSWWIHLTPYPAILFFGIGFTYAFHVIFTLTMLHREQSDLSHEGFIFSGVMILIFNQAFILGLLLLLSRADTISSILAVLGSSLVGSYRAIIQWVVSAAGV